MDGSFAGRRRATIRTRLTGPGRTPDDPRPVLLPRHRRWWRLGARGYL